MNSAAATADVFLTLCLFWKEKRQNHVFWHGKNHWEKQTLLKHLVFDWLKISRGDQSAKSWNKNGDVCNYSLNNDLLFLRMSLFFFLTAAAISWHSWSSFFCKFLFFGWLISFGFFSLAMQQKSSFFCKFFLVKETRPPFLKKKKLSNRERV